MSKLCKCSTCCYFKTAVTEFAPHHTEAKSAGWCSGKRHCYQCGQGRGGSRGRCGGCIPPPAIFKHVFDKCSFSITSNLFDNNKPYALSTHNQKCTSKMHLFGETLKFRGKKCKQNSHKNCSKSTKMATTVYKFSKIFRGSMPPDSLESFSFSICFKVILPETTTFEIYVKIW